jgi:hypothetical protein
MTTARTIVKKAMQKIGVLVKSETPDDDEANDALDALNALIDSWSNYGANIYSRVTETFPLSGATDYSIGEGQTFDTIRPIQIVNAFVSSSNVDYPLNIINREGYNQISQKNTGGIPYYLVYNNNFPFAQITLYPVPDGSYTLTILSEKAVLGFETLDTVLSLPPGWERALIYNLAIEIAPDYGQQVTPAVGNTATKSLGAIKLAVVRTRPVSDDMGIGQINNIYTGWNR